MSRETAALPRGTGAEVRRVEVDGRFEAISADGFWWECRKARLDPAVHMFVVVVDSGIALWDVTLASEALLQLSRKKLTVAYIRNAIGGSMALAASCRVVFAHPHATIGALGCFSELPLSDEEEVALNACKIREFHAARPEINPHAWGVLLYSVVNGTGAGQLGIIDFIASSEAEMLALFKVAKDKTQ